MDWSAIKTAICEGRGFTLTAEGCRLLTDVIMPSGAAVYASIQARGDTVSLHDGGAAFDELARSGREIGGMMGVRRMLSETRFDLSDDGAIWRHKVKPENVAVAVSLIADASLRAAQYLLAKSSFRATEPLDERVKEALRLRYQNGRADYDFTGKRKQHRFDFGVTLEEETVLVEAVHPTSLSSAVVKSIDAREARPNVVPILVYDPAEGWSSPQIELLGIGGRPIDVRRVLSNPLPLAA